MKATQEDTLNALRTRAEARAAVIGLPSRADEAWRYVDCKPLAVEPPNGAAPTMDVKDIRGWESQEFTASDANERWGASLDDCQEIGVLWSVAHLRDVVHLRLPAGREGHAHCVIETPAGHHGRRLVIALERGAIGHLIIEHRLGSARSSVGIEIDAAAGSQLTVEEIQSGDDAAQLLSHAWLNLARDARVTWTCAWRGGGLVRAAHHTHLRAAGAEVDFAGIGRVAGQRQAHQFLRVNHHAADTRSRQLVKNVIDGTAKTSFDGLIHIAKGADRSDAEQLNHNLLLAPGGRADTRPQLDIHADEVKAAHGATVGRPEDEQITYLRTRGLSLATARKLVQQGFSDEILHRFRHVAP